MPWFRHFGLDAGTARELSAWTDTGTATTSGLATWVTSSTATTTAATAGSLYNNWVNCGLSNQTTATNPSVTNTVWYSQQEDGLLHAQYFALAQGRVQISRVRTAEEQRQALETQRAQAEQHRIRMEQREAALVRSKELLLSHLTKDQRLTFETNRWFVVEGGRTKQRYRIRDGSYSGNIDVLNGERVSHRLCVHCLDGAVPLYDHLLAQKLHLQYDEDRLLQIANRHAA